MAAPPDYDTKESIPSPAPAGVGAAPGLGAGDVKRAADMNPNTGTMPPAAAEQATLNGSPQYERALSLQKTHTNPNVDEKTAKVVYEKSPGILRIEAVTSMFTKWNLVILFFAIFLVSYCYGLDGTLRYTYQNFALIEFGSSAQISTIAVVRSVIAAAAQPVFGKISDYFGRISILIISVILYVVGTIVQAVATNLATFSGGAVIYQCGYTGVQLLVMVILADVSSTRNRLLVSFIPATPFIINAWVTGTIGEKAMARYTPGADPSSGISWQWAIGMWAIIFPVVCLVLIVVFILARIRASRAGLLDRLPKGNPLSMSLWKDFFWTADVMGLVLLAGALTMILLPFTLAGGVHDEWKKAKNIAVLVVGFVVVLPLFVFWEMKFATHPVFPYYLFKDRQIVAGLLVAFLLNTSWYCQGDYLYYTVLVAFGKPLKQVIWTQNIYSFVSVIVGLCMGLVARRLRRLKVIVVMGASIILIAFGILIRFRGGHSTSDYAGLVAGEVLLGIAGGMLSYPTQALIQAAVKHERLAVVTATYLASYYIGSAVGNTIAGGIWTNTMPGHLADNLAKVTDNTTIAATVYADPTAALAYPFGDPIREAIDLAYRDVQRYLCITGICLAAVLWLITLTLRDIRLTDKQTNDEAEEWVAEDAVHDVSWRGMFKDPLGLIGLGKHSY